MEDRDTPSMESDARAIAQLFEQFTAAFNAEDLETLETFYTEDALVIPPGQPSFSGPEAIVHQFFAPTFARFGVEADMPIDEIQSAGGWGFVRGSYEMRLDPGAGDDPIVEEGSYIDVVRKDSQGDWKIARAIWNTKGSREGRRAS